MHHDGATAEYEIELAPTGLGAQLREALRVAAAGDLRLPPGLRHALRELVPIHLHEDCPRRLAHLPPDQSGIRRGGR